MLLRIRVILICRLCYNCWLLAERGCKQSFILLCVQIELVQVIIGTDVLLNFSLEAVSYLSISLIIFFVLIGLISVIPVVNVNLATKFVDFICVPLSKHVNEVIFIASRQLVLLRSLEFEAVVLCNLVHVLGHQVLRRIVAEC